jgi:site-specific DNA-adenine methylase
MMWSYYGGKSKLIDHYPPPKEGLIIEPFAGSARYALKYWDRDVLLVDKFDKIVKIWQYLINATREDILSLPNIDNGLKDSVDNYNIIDEEKWLIGFNICRGSASPRKSCGSFNNWKNDKIKIANNIYKIKHWKIQEGSYDDIENHQAAWYVDPPYQFGGEHYRHSNKKIDFNHLGEWCKSRNGQTIVCENTKADWLPFKPMIQFSGSVHTTVEAIWSNQPTAFDNEQMTMF